MNTPQTALALCRGARPVLGTININMFYNIYAWKNIDYICLHFAEPKICQCAFVSLCSDVGTTEQTCQIKSNQITFIVTTPQHKCLGEWNSYERAPDSAKKKKIYIWTVHIYRLYRRQCAKYTYIYSVHIVYYKDILNYQLHIIHRMGTSTLCTLSIHYVVYT